MRRNFGSGAPWEEIVGYSRAVRVGSRVCVTGTVGEGEDAYAQARDAFAKIAAVLERASGGLADVVRTRIFVTDIRGDWEAVGRAHKEAMGDTMPATTMVEVSRLIDERFVLEIEAEAELGGSLRPAHFNEAEVADLLTAAGLPVPGDRDRPVRMRVLEREGQVLACAGFELAGDAALLRSVTVREESRGQGVGRELVRGMLAEMSSAGVKQVYLLTLDATRFFADLGFESVERDAAPTGIRASREFEIHDCDTAQLMRGST